MALYGVHAHSRGPYRLPENAQPKPTLSPRKPAKRRKLILGRTDESKRAEQGVRAHDLLDAARAVFGRVHGAGPGGREGRAAVPRARRALLAPAAAEGQQGELAALPS